MRNAAKNLALTIGSLLVFLLIAEWATRSLGSYDADGNFTVRHRTLRPYRLPVAATKETVESLSSPFARTIYDPVLGWAPKPNGESADGLVRYNSLGIRSAPAEYSTRPRKGVVRIALFGDSFTHGDDVPFEQTWGYYLEQGLKRAGLAAEVMNFGVGGYGMDQAFLRWREFGYKFSPDLVLFGLQMENVKRNVNILRPLYSGTADLPFSKPRFAFSGERLELINSPALPPEELPEVMKNISAWPLLRYERFFEAENFRRRPWHASKFLSLAEKLLFHAAPFHRRADSLFYDPSTEPARLTLQIIREFQQSVESHHGRFLIVHLPLTRAMKILLEGGSLPYAALLKRIEENQPVIHSERELMPEAIQSLSALMRTQGHYRARGNELVARAIAEYLATGTDILPANFTRSNVKTL
jgi:hypothetical protein